MMAGTLMVLCVRFSSWFLHSMQHLAAGVLLSAISTELIPPIVHASDDTSDRLAIVVGFSLGVIVMVAVGNISDDEEEDKGNNETTDLLSSGSDSKTNTKPGALVIKPIRPLLRRHRSLKTYDVYSSPMASNDDQSYGAINLIEPGMENPSDSQPEEEAKLPVSRILGVEIDAFLDGFLLGLSASIGNSATINVMAIAISIEMCFVGVAFGAGFRNVPLWKTLPPLVLAPMTIVFGAVVGFLASSTFQSRPLLHIGLLSFGASALLYLVCEDLLIEAHTGGESNLRMALKGLSEGEHVDTVVLRIKEGLQVEERWHHDIFLFLGFLLTILTSSAHR
ncbi:hypothetical protein AAMO2058_000995900 [Amorphochlora amoebiformis]